MKFIKTELKDCYVIETEPKFDERGLFVRIFCKDELLDATGVAFDVVQSNIAHNKKRATLRGMHYQEHPFQEAKIVRCIKGAIYDVVVDLRPGSATFCRWFAVELNPDNHKMLYVPKDFAHGYITLKDDTEIIYFVSETYRSGSEKGVRWNDPVFDIKWPLKPELISDKDMNFPDFVK